MVTAVAFVHGLLRGPSTLSVSAGRSLQSKDGTDHTRYAVCPSVPLLVLVVSHRSLVLSRLSPVRFNSMLFFTRRIPTRQAHQSGPRNTTHALVVTREKQENRSVMGLCKTHHSNRLNAVWVVRVRDDQRAPRGVEVRVRDRGVDVAAGGDGCRFVHGHRGGPGAFGRGRSFDLFEEFLLGWTGVRVCAC